jgi:hypothetical protein
MKRLSLLLLATILAAPLAAQTRREIELRAFLHDPVRPTARFQYPDKSGSLQPLALMVEGLSESCTASLVDDELLLHDEAGAITARGRVAASCKRAAVIVLPAAAGSTLPYRLIAVNDAPATFPWGSSQVVSLLGVETALQAGEHRLALPAGRITAVPEVTKVDEFNMAQVNFHYREGQQWVPFTERRLQFVADIRRIFLVYATPGSQRPFVVTLVDQPPPEVR